MELISIFNKYVQRDPYWSCSTIHSMASLDYLAKTCGYTIKDFPNIDLNHKYWICTEGDECIMPDNCYSFNTFSEFNAMLNNTPLELIESDLD